MYWTVSFYDTTSNPYLDVHDHFASASCGRSLAHEKAQSHTLLINLRRPTVEGWRIGGNPPAILRHGGQPGLPVVALHPQRRIHFVAARWTARPSPTPSPLLLRPPPADIGPTRRSAAPLATRAPLCYSHYQHRSASVREATRPSSIRGGVFILTFRRETTRVPICQLCKPVYTSVSAPSQACLPPRGGGGGGV